MNLFERLEVKSALHTCLFLQWTACLQWNAIAYNGDVTSMRNYRYKRTRECTSDFVNKASKVIESLPVPVTLIPLLLTMMSLERVTHIAHLSSLSLLILIKALKQSVRSKFLSFALICVILLLQKDSFRSFFFAQTIHIISLFQNLQR